MVYARTLSLSRLLVIRLVCSVFYHHLEASLLFPILVGIQCFLFDHHREALCCSRSVHLAVFACSVMSCFIHHIATSLI